MLRCTVLAVALLAMASAQAHAAKVLFLVGEGFNAGEFWTPYLGLQSAGHDVTVAGVARGTIAAGSKDRTLDATADLSLEEVSIETFDALVIPGGYGPRNLEKYPRAIEIAKQFLESGKPTAAICHGPRLLAQTGLLKARVATALNTVKDELPELWTRGEFGAYVDRDVVVDGNLITSRYPNDAARFAQRVHHHLTGRRDAPPLLRPGVRVIDGGARSVVFGVSGALAVQHLDVRVGGTSLLEGASATSDLIILTPGDKLAAALADPKRSESLQSLAAAGRVIAIGEASKIANAEGVKSVEGDNAAALARAAELAAGLVPPAEPVTDERPLALVAVRSGFDDRVVLGIESVLHVRGFRVEYASDTHGWRHGGQGAVVEATHTFAKAPDAQLIVAPGHLRPADGADAAFRDFLLALKETPLIAFGFDSLLIGNDARFKGTKFASSEQAVWSFKGGASFTASPAVQSTPTLITARDAAAIREVLRLMDAPPPAKP